MRSIATGLLILTACASGLLAAEPADPTAEELSAAKEVYAKHGAQYEALINLEPKRTTHTMFMPNETTDADLKDLPELPFRFGLSLNRTEVTDGGLRALSKLKKKLDLSRSRFNGHNGRRAQESAELRESQGH